ncbi:hypothetical protein SKAU_G00302350 [Synaphobranchus kaupii]|uniref:Uncharacterized protein n=1 Tax=Synaphobranchus kaupii TaxID=118154 RepID=A0A9Q1EVX2_SYNKA|nr:hypothetical protein SKAU_G00302350 [Synaphobranchus kaupii]
MRHRIPVFLSIMSLLTAVDEALRFTQVQEAKINENINQLREILFSMKAQPREAPEEEVPATNNEEGVLPEEREEMELLDRVLQRALRVRCRSGAPRGPETAGGGAGDAVGSDRAKSDGSASGTASKSAFKASVDQTASRRTASASRASKEAGRESGHRAGPGRGGVAQTSVRNRTAVSGRAVPSRRPGAGRQSAPAPAPGEPCHPQASSAGAHERATQRGPCAEETGTVWDIRQHPREDPTPVTCLVGTGEEDRSLSTTKGGGKPSVAPSVWRAHSTKHGRLWDKVLTAASKPVAEKARFTERLLDTFPCKLPDGSPADTRAEVERLTQLCRALTHCLQTEALAHRTGSRTGTGACWELEYESLLMQEGLEKVVRDLRGRVEKLKRDAEAWDRWGPSDCCPVQRRGRWGDPDAPDLPHTLRYASEAELKELEGLRLRVAQLQQEIHLHQAMREALTPCMTSAWSARGGPSAIVLRGLYSLLGEGGAQFPAVVLDTEPD